MTDLVEIDDSDELPPPFMILDDEFRQNITAILSFDKTNILATPKVISKAGSGSSTQAPKLLRKLDNQQVFLTCSLKMKMV